MLLINISPLYLKCGALLSNSDSLIKDLENYKEKFKYIISNLDLDYNKSNKLILFEINYLQIDDFTKSPDFEFLSNHKIINNLNLEEKQGLENNLLEYKENNNILSEPILKNKDIPKCYYCGELTGKKEYIIFKIFQKKCEKYGDITQLTISGIDYINNNLENSFYDLPNEPISNLVILGKHEKLVDLTEKNKNKISLKNKMYPYLLTTGEEGISIYRVDSINSYKKIGNNVMGPTSLWSLLNLTGNYEDPKLALKEALNGNNELIDLSVGDIYGGDYGGASLCSDLIASSFSKISHSDNAKKVDTKDIGKALLIFYGVTYGQVSALISSDEKIERNIISGNTFGSLGLMQIIQISLGLYSGNTIGAFFNDYSNYYEIVGMIFEMGKNGLLENNN